MGKPVERPEGVVEIEDDETGEGLERGDGLHGLLLGAARRHFRLSEGGGDGGRRRRRSAIGREEGGDQGVGSSHRWTRCAYHFFF